MSAKVNTDGIKIFAGAMEATGAVNIMDFANSRIHIHRIIPSATQEEVLFSCCPEAFIALLLYDALDDDEVAVIRGVRRYIRYSGYLDTFRYEGPFIPSEDPVLIPDTAKGPSAASRNISGRSARDQQHRIETLLVADAVMSRHRQPRSVQRDLTKAYMVFRLARYASLNPVVATGHWGCGIFGGDKRHKFALQVCAATAAGAELNYAVFADPVLEADFRRQLAAWAVSGATLRTLYRSLL